jgi:hypothetical protein
MQSDDACITYIGDILGFKRISKRPTSALPDFAQISVCAIFYRASVKVGAFWQKRCLPSYLIFVMPLFLWLVGPATFATAQGCEV